MDSYPVDADPEQVVRWLMVERQKGSVGLQIIARRINEVQEIENRPEFRLGDEEREDLSDKATIATLEISPAHASEGWRLIMSVEDEFRPSAPDEDSEEAEKEEPIDLDTFYLDFIRPRCGTANVMAEVEGPEGRSFPWSSAQRN